MRKRPATARFEMRVPAEFLRLVDEWRGQQPGIPSRAKAIQALAEAGLSVPVVGRLTPGERQVIELLRGRP